MAEQEETMAIIEEGLLPNKILGIVFHSDKPNVNSKEPLVVVKTNLTPLQIIDRLNGYERLKFKTNMAGWLLITFGIGMLSYGVTRIWEGLNLMEQ